MANSLSYTHKERQKHTLIAQINMAVSVGCNALADVDAEAHSHTRGVTFMVWAGNKSDRPPLHCSATRRHPPSQGDRLTVGRRAAAVRTTLTASRDNMLQGGRHDDV